MKDRNDKYTCEYNYYLGNIPLPRPLPDFLMFGASGLGKAYVNCFLLWGPS